MNTKPLPLRVTLLLLLIGFSLSLVACDKVTPPEISAPTQTLMETGSAPPTITPASTATATTTPTPPPSLAVLLARAEADSAQVSAFQTALNGPISGAGLRWQVRQQLSAEDLTPELRLVIALPPDPGLAALVAAAPDTQFLAVGIPDLPPAPNLSVIGAQGPRPDQHGFIAGAIAAIITPDWRVGVISVSDTTAGNAARQGFINGAVYFCGLCRPTHPPFYEYPLYVEMPAGASPAEWKAAADYLIDHYAQTAYVYPGAGDESTLEYLAQAGVNLIGSSPPPEGLSQHWVASLSSDLLPIVEELISSLLAGQGGVEIPMPLVITQVNAELFSPGRQNLAQEILSNLLEGYIDTGAGAP